jgi:hypothetical protein
VGGEVERHPPDAGHVGRAGQEAHRLRSGLALVPAPRLRLALGRDAPELVARALHAVHPHVAREVDGEDVDHERRRVLGGHEVDSPEHRVGKAPAAMVVPAPDVGELVDQWGKRHVAQPTHESRKRDSAEAVVGRNCK